MYFRFWRAFSPFLGLGLSVVLLGLVLSAFSWGLSDAQLKVAVKDYGLFCLVGAVVLSMFSAWRCAKGLVASRVFGFLKRRWWLVFVWGGCCLYATSLYEPGYRTLMDEVVVLSTSKAIHEDREPLTPTGFEHAMGVKRLSLAYVDKRPYLYAWLVSLLHDIRGYSIENPFLVNRILGCFTLALVGLTGWLLSARREAGSIMAMLALSAVTLFPQHVSGGGIDILNIACLMGVFLCAYLYVRMPTPDSMRLLMGATVLAAYARYEAIIFLAFPVLLMAWRWRACRKVDLDLGGGLYAVAIFPLCALHYLTFSQSEQSFQLVEKKLEKAFSFEYVNENLRHAWSFFTDQDDLLTNSTLVFGLGVFAVISLIVARCAYVCRRRGVDFNLPGVFWLFAGFIMAIFMLLMCYAWGDIRQPVASRLALPMYLLFALSIAIVAARAPVRWRVTPCVCIALGIAAYWSSYRLASKDYHTKLYAAHQRIARYQEFIDKQSDANFAVVNDAGIFWLTRGVVSIYPTALASNPSYLVNVLKSGIYSRVYFIEELIEAEGGGGFAPAQGSIMPDSLVINSQVVWSVAGADNVRFRFSLIEDAGIKQAEKDACVVSE